MLRSVAGSVWMISTQGQAATCTVNCLADCDHRRDAGRNTDHSPEPGDPSAPSPVSNTPGFPSSTKVLAVVVLLPVPIRLVIRLVARFPFDVVTDSGVK
jgi:hypothetical protein